MGNELQRGGASDSKEILTPREAAQLLQVSLETVRRLLRNGQLPGRKVGPRQWRIRRADLDEYLRWSQTRSD
jgi:excisionase family DNA binding protein